MEPISLIMFRYLSLTLAYIVIVVADVNYVHVFY